MPSKQTNKQMITQTKPLTHTHMPENHMGPIIIFSVYCLLTQTLTKRSKEEREGKGGEGVGREGHTAFNVEYIVLGM